MTEELGYNLDQCGYPHEEEEILAPMDLIQRYEEQRAGLAALTGTVTIDNILDESACENFGNGARWMDLRRTKTLVERCTKYNHEMGDKAAQYIGEKLLRPIPQAAIDANDMLTSADQNPGY